MALILRNLLKTLAEKTKIQRIRYTTSHPKDFHQDLVDVMQKQQKKICEYVHLPVQSGNTDATTHEQRVHQRGIYR